MYYSSSSDDSSSDGNGLLRGNGHTKSWYSTWQNSRIVLYRYHCLFTDRPCGINSSGSDDLCGFQDMSFTSFIFCSVLASLEYFTQTCPGEPAENWNPGIPLGKIHGLFCTDTTACLLTGHVELIHQEVMISVASRICPSPALSFARFWHH